jgi:polyisoprenoid-binding protein YceI
MKNLVIILSIAFGAIVTSNAQSIDTQNSVVNFKVNGMFGVEVEGTFSGMQGTIEFDENNLTNSSFDVTINAASVFTDNNKRDQHLKNEDFFEVETYANIRFKSKSITKTSNGFNTKGTITMHGVSQPASIDFSYENKTFTGQLEVNRFDYKVGESVKTNKVAELTKVEIICVIK